MKLSRRISQDLELDQNYVEYTALMSRKKHSRYFIPKKSGGYRRIHHPSPELKVLQYWMVENIFKYCKVSEYSSAYEVGCSIKKNAEVHKDSKHFLTMDFSNFFESISDSHLLSLLNDNIDNIPFNIYDEDKFFLKKVCLYNSHLVIGSVCSPRISNCVMYDFDIELMDILNEYGDFKYTRYADDLTISSNQYIVPKVAHEVNKLAIKHGFKINDNKTNFSSPKNRRKVTGLIVDNGNITIGLNRKREIKSKLYNYLEKGEGNNEEILGLLYFLKDIEPGYFNKLIIKYSKYGNILKILKNPR